MHLSAGTAISIKLIVAAFLFITAILKKQTNCKNDAALFKMANVKRSCEIKGGGQEMAVMV